MKELSDREFKLLILAVVIIVGGSLLKWVIFPGIDSYQNLKARLVTADHNWEKRRMLLEKGEEYKKSLQQAKGELKAVSSLIFQGDISKIRLQGLDILEQRIKESGLQVNNKNIKVSNLENQNYKKITYNLTLDGRYKQLINFLQKIKQEKRHFIVNKLRVDGGINRRSKKLRINTAVAIITKEGGAAGE